MEARVRSSWRSCLFFSIFFCPTFFLYYLRNPDTTGNKQHTSSAGRVPQTAGHNAKYTLLPPASRTRSNTITRVRQFLSALCRCGFLSIITAAFFIGPCDLYSWGSPLLCCDTRMLPQIQQHCCCCSCCCCCAIFVGSRVWSSVPPPSSVNAIPLLIFFFVGGAIFLCERGVLHRERHYTKACIHILTNHDTVSVWRNHQQNL